MVDLILVRHGETEWSRAGRHTGSTDVPLTERGEDQARALATFLADQRVGWTLCSPLTRARRTASLAGLPDAEIDPRLREWDYGGYEGLDAEQVRRDRPGWVLWRDGVPPGDASHPGETVAQVGARADGVIAHARSIADSARLDAGSAETESCVALVGHGHMLRVLAARWIGRPAADGALLRLEPASVCRLGHEHGRPVIKGWNFSPRSPIG